MVYHKGFHSADTIIGEYGVTKGRYYIGSFNNIHRPYFQKTKSGLLFNNYLSDTIWNINDSKKEPAYILDLKDELLPYEKQPEFYFSNVQKATEIKKPYHSVHLIPFSSYNFIFQVHYSDYRYDAIYLEDIKTGEIKRFDNAFIYDDLIGKTKLTVVFPDCSEDYFVALAAWKSIEVAGGGKKYMESPSPLWVKQMESIDEEANPILVLVKIKKRIP